MNINLKQTINFTQKSIESLTIPQDKSIIFYDEKEPKLYILVSKTGRKTFYLLSRIKNRVARIKIGTFPDIKVEKAREFAKQLKASIACGNDPEKNRLALKTDITFKELFDLYIEKSQQDGKKSWKICQCVINKHCAHFLKRKLATISHQEVSNLVEELGITSKNSANTVLKKLKAIFNFGIEKGILKSNNPANNIKSYNEVRRDRFLLPQELSDFFEVLALAPENLRDIVSLAIYTGARKSNIMSMEWQELDLINNLWRIPASKSKNGDVMIIPILPEAKEILFKRKSISFQSNFHFYSKKAQRERLNTLFNQFVFPSVRNSTGHLLDTKRLWNKFRSNFYAKSNSQNIRFHDLRRTLASYEALTGQYSLQIIGKSLGHKSTASTEIYARLMTEPVRQSMQSGTNLMKEQMILPTFSQMVQNGPRLSKNQT